MVSVSSSACGPAGMHSPCGPCTDAEDASILTDATRELGLLVCRGTSVMLVCPEDGTEEISNPFVQTEAAELEGED